MKKLIFILSLVFISSVVTAAQTPSEIKKSEVFIGYSRGVIDGDSRRFFITDNNFRDVGTKAFHGFEVSGIYNISRHIGIKGDVSGHYESGSFTFPVGNLTPTPRPTFAGTAKNSLYNVLAGVQFKDNAKDDNARFKPFAHILAGVGQVRTNINATCTPAVNCVGVDVPTSSSERGFAGAFGGGLDVQLNDRFDLRVIQFDYNPVVLNSGTLHNFRMGVGIVIK